jgi:hypothetical protein
MVFPATRIHSDAGRSFAPPQVGQGWALWYWRRKTRMYCL